MANVFGWCGPCMRWCAELAREMCRSQDGMHDLLCSQFQRGREDPEPRGVPPGAAVDLFSGDGDLVARAELPGVGQQDVESALSEGRITVSGDEGYRSVEYRVRQSRDEPFRVRRSG